MKFVCIVPLLVGILVGIFVCAWLRKKFKQKIEPIDLCIVGFIFFSCLFFSGKITDFELASMKIKAAKEDAIEAIKEQQEIATLWIQVLDAENMKEPEQAINYIDAILSKGENWQAYDHLGSAYEALAEKHTVKNRKDELLIKAKDAFIKASELNDNIAAVNVAQIYAYFDQEKKTKEWLLKAETSNRLPTYDDIAALGHLSKYLNTSWFKELKWKEYK